METRVMLTMESRIHGNMYVRFGGRLVETYHRKVAKRCWPSLLKEAAELAGLDREIVETYFIGTQRYEEIHKFYETISCHDGRRTFVCCSLALGISPTVVMSCTGHADYESMKPYIEVADETQKMQMEKWNTHQYKSDIIESLDKMNPTQLKELCEHIRSIA